MSDPNHTPSLNYEATRQSEALQRAHEKFGIPLNVSEVVDRTLEQNGFTMLESVPTPTVEEWITEKITEQGYAGYNHGSFVTDEDGNLGFAKVHYGPDNILSRVNADGEVEKVKVGGPQREALVLDALTNHGYKAPFVLGYSPESPEGASSAEANTYEILAIEAVLPENGAVREREDWTPALAQKAAQKITTFAQPIESIELFRDETIPLSAEELVRKLPRTGDAYDHALTETLEAYPHLDSPIVVHGDTWFNNIIASHDDSDIMFVDWELAGPGYRGQDAGRKLWDLTLNNDWSFADYGDAAHAFTEEWCATEDDTHSLTFGVMYESLRWISDRIDKIEDPATDEATRVSLAQEIDEVKSHTLEILNYISAR